MEKSVRNYILLICLALIWGSSFILMKRGLVIYTDTQVAALRLFIAFLSLTPFLLKAVRVIKKKHIFPVLIMAFFGNGIPAFLFAKAQTQLDSSIVGILNSLVPLFTLLLGVYFFKYRPSTINIIGVIIGFIGATILALSTINEGISLNGYVLLVVIATAMYAISINVIKKYLYDLDAVSITSIAFLVIGPLSALYIFNTDFLMIASTNEGSVALVYIFILAVIGTSLAVVIFNKLVSDSSAVFASSVTYLIPIVAIFWGVMDGEDVTLAHLFSVVIILIGVYLVNRKITKD